jgi:hypothetical protein
MADPSIPSASVPPPRRATGRARKLLAVAVALVVAGCAISQAAEPSAAPRTVATLGSTATTPASVARSAAPNPAVTIAPTSATPPATSVGPARVAVPLKLPAFQMDIYRKGTFVSQIDKHHCMSAAMQNMLNLIGPKVDTTAATQRRISDLAHRLSDDALDHTWGPNGWAKGLTQLGVGQYVVVVYDTRAAQLKAAVEALRRTGRPVGILAWWGAHSWVLTGFRASADPALTARYTVSAYNIVDPWYPRVSSIWGRSAAPDALHSPANMVHNLPAWTRPEGHYPDRDGKWLLVLPVDPPTARGGPSDHALPYLSPMSVELPRA